jgi:DNA-binding NtrC family response regulator
MSAATIQVIDDDKLSRWSVSTLLGRAGYDVREAATGKEGLASIQDVGPRLVLLDIELPDMDGFTVLAKIREARPDLPVLMMTADATVESARRALRLGAQGQLPKPIDAATLDAAVSRALKSIAPPGHPSR